MAEYHDLDLHGVLPESPRVAALLSQAAQFARRRHLGLRVIHGRGEHVLADIVQSLLRQQGLEYMEGVLNPGETRIEARALQRHVWR